jgi:hypothetical protein
MSLKPLLQKFDDLAPKPNVFEQDGVAPARADIGEHYSNKPHLTKMLAFMLIILKSL